MIKFEFTNFKDWAKQAKELGFHVLLHSLNDYEEIYVAVPIDMIHPNGSMSFTGYYETALHEGIVTHQEAALASSREEYLDWLSTRQPEED